MSVGYAETVFRCGGYVRFVTSVFSPINLQRGFAKSLLFGALGFLVPIVFLGLIAICRFVFIDIHPMDRDAIGAALPRQLLTPGIGCAIVFGVAAFGSYAPRNGIGFTRALIIVGIVAVLSFHFANPYRSYRMVIPNAWIGTVVPVLSVLITCNILIALGSRSAAEQESE